MAKKLLHPPSAFQNCACSLCISYKSVKERSSLLCEIGLKGFRENNLPVGILKVLEKTKHDSCKRQP